MKVLALTLLGALAHAVAVTNSFNDSEILAETDQTLEDGLEIFKNLA